MGKKSSQCSSDEEINAQADKTDLKFIINDTKLTLVAAKTFESSYLKAFLFFHHDQNSKLKEKIYAKKVPVSLKHG